MKVELSISKIRGIALIWIRKKYHALWFEWAEGAQVLLNGERKILWICPRIRYIHF